MSIIISRWVRRNARYLLAVVVVLLMVSWGVGPVLRQCSRSGSGTAGVIRGGSVIEHHLKAAARNLRIAHMLGIMGPDLRQFVFQDTQQIGGDQAWRYLVLVREAEAAGIQVTQEEAMALRKALPAFTTRGSFDTPSYQAFLDRYDLRDSYVRSALSAWASTLMLRSFKTEAVKMSQGELWEQYAYGDEKARVKFVAIEPELFLPMAQVSGDDLQQHYEQHKETIPDPLEGIIGYKFPEAVRIEYALASAEDFIERIEITDAEVSDYYEDNKSEFRIPEQEKEEDAEGVEQPRDEDTQTDAGAEDEAGSTAETQEQPKEEAEAVEVDSDKPQEAAEESGPEQKRYRPLSEVKEEIRDKLLGARAEAAAGEAGDKGLDYLQSREDSFINERLPLEQMALTFGLRYVAVESRTGNDFVSAYELESLVPEGRKVAEFAFDRTLGLYYPHRIDTEQGPLICQVLAHRESQVLPYEQVADRVRENVLRENALARAKDFADRLMQQAARSSLEEAVEKMNDVLAFLLEEKGNESESGQDEEAAPELEIVETDSFTRDALYVHDKGGRMAETVGKAFSMGLKELAVVTELRPRSMCYVVEKTAEQEADPEQFHSEKALFQMILLRSKQRAMVRAWMEELLQRSVRFARQE